MLENIKVSLFDEIMELTFSKYVSNDCLAITLIGEEGPYDKITVNLNGLAQNEIALNPENSNYSNYINILFSERIIKSVDPHRTLKSGWVDFSVFQLTDAVAWRISGE